MSSSRMGCGDACPVFPGKRYEDWVLDDPAGLDVGRHPSDPRRDRAPGPPVARRARRTRCERPVSTTPLWRRSLAEGIGTGLLVTVVIGSGIAASRLSPNDVGLQLLENAFATALGLAVLILMIGPVSGAHFNPVVSAVDWWLGRRTGSGLSSRDLTAYVPAQTVGGGAGRRTGESDVRRSRGVLVDDRTQRRPPVARRGRRDGRAYRADLRPRLIRARRVRTGRGRRLHRCLRIGSPLRPRSRIRRSRSVGPSATPSQGSHQVRCRAL